MTSSSTTSCSTSRGRPPAGTATVFVVHTDTGEIGLGEGSPEPEEVLAQYIGTSPFEWVNDVTSLAIGTAMYDLMGKSVGLPTYLLRQTFLLALPLFRSTDI